MDIFFQRGTVLEEILLPQLKLRNGSAQYRQRTMKVKYKFKVCACLLVLISVMAFKQTNILIERRRIRGDQDAHRGESFYLKIK